LNVTIDSNATAQSFITVWPTGAPRPLTSANNATPGLVMPNSILVPLGTDGQVSLYNFAGNVNLAVDLAGYTLPITSSGQTGPQGPTGPRGTQGPSGPTGPKGDIGFAPWQQATQPTPAALADGATTTVLTMPAVPNANYIFTTSYMVQANTGTPAVSC